MDEKTETKPSEFKCKVCEDTGKVHLGFNGASGLLLKEVPCPDCPAGQNMIIRGDELLKSLQSDSRTALLVAVGAGVLAAIALAKLSKHNGNGFAEAVKEEVTQ